MNLIRGFFDKRRNNKNTPQPAPITKTEPKREFNKTPDDFQFFLAEAFKLAGHQLLPPHKFIRVENKYPGNYMEFALRLKSQTPSPLPPAQILQTFDGSDTNAANYLILGSIQMFGGQCQINMRVDKVETGEILSTGKGSGSCDANGVKAAAHAALYGLIRGA